MIVLSGLSQVIYASLVVLGNGMSPYSVVNPSVLAIKKTEP
jgi:hypothetical protein